MKQRILILGVALLALAGWVCLAQPAMPIALGQAGEGEIDAPAGGGGALNIAGASFVPESSTTVYHSDMEGGVAVTGSSHRFMHAPVLLPDGAQLVGIQFYYLDNELSDYMSASLFRNNDPALGQGVALATAQSPAGVSGYGHADSGVDPAYAEIDNARYNYEIEVEWSTGSADLRAMNVRVFYTNP